MSCNLGQMCKLCPKWGWQWYLDHTFPETYFGFHFSSSYMPIQVLIFSVVHDFKKVLISISNISVSTALAQSAISWLNKVRIKTVTGRTASNYAWVVLALNQFFNFPIVLRFHDKKMKGDLSFSYIHTCVSSERIFCKHHHFKYKLFCRDKETIKL